MLIFEDPGEQLAQQGVNSGQSDDEEDNSTEAPSARCSRAGAGSRFGSLSGWAGNDHSSSRRRPSVNRMSEESMCSRGTSISHAGVQTKRAGHLAWSLTAWGVVSRADPLC